MKREGWWVCARTGMGQVRVNNGRWHIHHTIEAEYYHYEQKNIGYPRPLPSNPVHIMVDDRLLLWGVNGLSCHVELVLQSGRAPRTGI